MEIVEGTAVPPGRRGILLAPLDDDPVVLHYVRPFLERIEVLKEGKEGRIFAFFLTWMQEKRAAFLLQPRQTASTYCLPK
jgi:hypothetical protein